MKHYETIAIPESTRERETHVTCDICGKKFGHSGAYERDEVEIRRKDGCYYPEGSYGTVTEYDICAGCFVSKLVPWMTSQGATPSVTDFEY